MRAAYIRRMPQRPLEGLRVVETAGVLAGPAVGMFLAELGAHVVKIENARAGGDITRQWKLPEEDPRSPVSAYFSSVNHGKEHRPIDLKDPAGQAEVHALIADADVLISNHLAADATKLGLERPRLRALNPRLVHGHIIGYPHDAQRPAYDVVLQAECGYIGMTGTPEAAAKLPVAMIDILAAHQLKEGLLVALMQRERTGRGAYVEVSLEEAALTGLVNQASNFLMAGHVAQPLGTLHPNIAPYGELFTCADGGRIVLAVGSDTAFRALCTVVGLEGVLAMPRFATNTDRVRHRTELAGLLAPAIARHHRDALLDALRTAGVPAGAVRRMDEVLATPTAQALIAEEVIDGVTTRRLRGNVFRIELG